MSYFLKREYLLIFVITLFGLFLRLYRLPENFYYTMDEEVMNLIQRRIATGEHLPLIGSVSAIGTYLGPIFYYFGAAILFFSSLNPLGQSIFACLLGSVTTVLIYRIAKELFNKETGIMAAALHATSFLTVIFDRRYWHLTPGPILALIVLWSLYKIKKGSFKFIYLLAAALIFGWNTDYTNIILFLFTAICWLILKLPVKRKEVMIACVIFLVSNAPLVLFDLRHDFLNTKTFIAYFTRHKTNQVETQADRQPLGENRIEQFVQTAFLPFITLSRIIYTTSDLNISEQHTYCKPYILERNRQQGIFLPGFAALCILTFFAVAKMKRKNKLGDSFKLIMTFYLIFQIGVLGYAAILKGDVFEHYLATLLPILLIMGAYLLSVLYSSKFKLLAIAIISLFMVMNMSLVLNAYNPFGFSYKIAATKYAIEEIGSSKFSLDSLSSCYRWDGFYYPFIYLGRHPEKSYQDPNYSWLYNYQIPEKHPEKIVVMVPKGDKEEKKFIDTYSRYQQWIQKKGRFGGIEVLILDNSKGDFK